MLITLLCIDLRRSTVNMTSLLVPSSLFLHVIVEVGRANVGVIRSSDVSSPLPLTSSSVAMVLLLPEDVFGSPGLVP